jgi:dipeptidyl aminopeptidase/acylaminoacyl peptidase
LPILRLAAATALAALIAACATRGPAVLAPNANLHVQGIPPVPLSLVREVERYTDFRGHAFVDWHPTRREMLVAHRAQGADTAQLFRLDAPMAVPQPLTRGAEPVTRGTYEPTTGRYVVFERASGGDEAAQLYRIDLDSRAETLLTEPGQRWGFGPWLHRRSALLAASVPLDRTAAGGTRASIATTLWLIDPLQPAARRRIAELPGSGWLLGEVSRDDRTLVLGRYLSVNQSQVWLLDLASGERRQLLPGAGAPAAAPVTHLPGPLSPDGTRLFYASDRAGEFSQLHAWDLASARSTPVTGDVPWDVSGGTLTDDGRWLAVQTNEDGSDRLRLYDARTLAEARLPAALPAGNVGTTRFHKARAELAFSLNSAQGPSQLYSLDVPSGRVEQWTRAEAAPGIDTSRFADQRIVRWTAFDGRALSGLLSMPPARFTGKRPVLIDIHGGPEAQASIGFLGRSQFYVQELGVAIIRPNVRGSRGYGKTFLALDNGRLREDAVKDIGALLDWIATQPELDASRVVVAGGSYGGYMTLATAATYPERIAGAIDVVGISHFVTFLESTESYRRDLRRVEYGDERDPAMREFLHRISPLTNAQRITKPLFVVQGRNDPRVPVGEAEQIVAKVRANGTPVWYLRAENEGHGFARKENADYQFYATVLFLRRVLGL